MTKGKILSAVLCFCDLRADCLESKVTSDRELSIYSLGYPRASRRHLKFARHSSNVVFEEFVLSSLIASPLIKPLFTSEDQIKGSCEQLMDECYLVPLFQNEFSWKPII